MKWYYESDGDANNRTHYLCLDDEYFTRVDFPSKSLALKLLSKFNNGTARPPSTKTVIGCYWEELEDNPFSTKKINEALISNNKYPIKNDSESYKKVWVCYSWFGEPIGIL